MLALVLFFSALIMLSVKAQVIYLKFHAEGTNNSINCNDLVNLLFADDNLGSQQAVDLWDLSGYTKEVYEVWSDGVDSDYGTKGTRVNTVSFSKPFPETFEDHYSAKPFRAEVANICCEAKPKRGRTEMWNFLDETKAISTICDMDVTAKVMQENEKPGLQYDVSFPCTDNKAAAKRTRKENEQFCEELSSEPERAISSAAYNVPKGLNPTTPSSASSSTPTLSNHSIPTPSAPTQHNAWSPGIIAGIALACGALVFGVGVLCFYVLVKSGRKFTYWINGKRAPLSQGSVAMKDSLL